MVVADSKILFGLQLIDNKEEGLNIDSKVLLILPLMQTFSHLC